MSFAIKRFPVDSDEHKRLSAAAAMLTVKSPTQSRYYVGETYFDYGQDWKWTTVLCTGGTWGDYQALNPAEQEEILLCDMAELDRITSEVLADKFCPDHL